jgi:anti-anti-sigma factor
MTLEHTSGYAVDDFSVSLSAGEGVVRVGLAGDLDYSSTHLLDPVAAAVLLLGPLVVQIDVRRLRFCDIAGVRQIVDLHRSWHEHGLSVSMHGARPPVRQVFNLAGQSDLLQPHRRTADWK